MYGKTGSSRDSGRKSSCCSCSPASISESSLHVETISKRLQSMPNVIRKAQRILKGVIRTGQQRNGLFPNVFVAVMAPQDVQSYARLTSSIIGDVAESIT